MHVLKQFDTPRKNMYSKQFCIEDKPFFMTGKNSLLFCNFFRDLLNIRLCLLS